MSNTRHTGSWMGKRLPDYAATSRHRARRAALPRERAPVPLPPLHPDAHKLAEVPRWARLLLPGRQGQR